MSSHPRCRSCLSGCIEKLLKPYTSWFFRCRTSSFSSSERGSEALIIFSLEPVINHFPFFGVPHLCCFMIFASLLVHVDKKNARLEVEAVLEWKDHSSKLPTLSWSLLCLSWSLVWDQGLRCWSYQKCDRCQQNKGNLKRGSYDWSYWTCRKAENGLKRT